MTDIIFVAEEPGVIVYVNQAALEILGADSVDEIRGRVHRFQRLFEILYPDGRPMPLDERPMSRLMRGEHFRNMACRLRNLRGKEAELLVSGGPVKPVPGMPKHYVQVSRDVTEVRRLERAKEHFMLVVGHELRNPLTSIQGFVDLLEAQLLPQVKDDRIVKYVRLMRVEVERLAQLVDDLLNAYRVSSGRLALNLQPTEFGQVLAEAAGPYEVNPAGREIAVTRLPEPATVNGDHRRLIEVLTNLMSNAIKYTRPGGHIWVKAAVDGENVVARVEDRSE
ncbi:MAG: sensor histidine kinase, partial [Bacillota bacterium]